MQCCSVQPWLVLSRAPQVVVCCSVIYCVAMCCRVLQCAALAGALTCAAGCSVLQCIAVFCSVVREPEAPHLRAPAKAAHCNTLQHTAIQCTMLQHTATHCNTLQHTATHCNTLQLTATHCNTLRHTHKQKCYEKNQQHCGGWLTWLCVCVYVCACVCVCMYVCVKRKILTHAHSTHTQIALREKAVTQQRLAPVCMCACV